MSMPSGIMFAEPRRAVRVEAPDDLALADLQHRDRLRACRLDHFDRRLSVASPGLRAFRSSA